MMTEYFDYPSGKPGLAEWLAQKAAEGWLIDGAGAIAVLDENGEPVIRYPARRA